jgi:hypothetical protein
LGIDGGDDDDNDDDKLFSIMMEDLDPGSPVYHFRYLPRPWDD